MGNAVDKKAEKKASKKTDKKVAKSPAKPAAAKETTPAKVKPLSSKEILAKANSKSKPSKKDKSSSEESESESEDEKPAPKANGKTKASEPAKRTPAKSNGKAKEPSPSGESSESESESEDEKPKAAQVKVTPKKVASSSSSESESSSEEEAPKKAAPAAKTATPVKAPAKPATSSSEESDSDESSSEDEAPKKPAAIPAFVKATPAKAASSSSGESDSDEESSSEEEEAPKKGQQKATPAKTTPAKTTPVKKQESDDSEEEDSSDESSEDEDVEMAEETAKLSKGKRKADDEASAPAKKTKVANGDAVATDGSEPTMTIFVGRLSWNVDNDWLAQEFAECGEVVEARVQMDRNTGKSRGFAYVTFATAEAAEAALQLNGKEIDGRPVNIDKSTPKPPAERRDARAKAFGDTQSPPSAVLFIGSLSWDATEDMLWETFSEYGEVKSVRVPTDRDTGRPKGFGYVEFSDVDSAKKALEGAAGAEIAGRAIRLDYSERRDGATRGFGDRGGRGRGRGFGGQGFGGQGFGGGDRGGGDRGSRGGGRGGSRGRGGDQGRGRGGGRGGRGFARTGAIAQPEGTKVTFD